MAKYPEAQTKAQAELDAVIGPHRLPELSDRPHLPYVNALIKETMRWQLVSPLGKCMRLRTTHRNARLTPNVGLAHMATDDDVYGGYFIPKGSIVIGNAWYVT